MAGRKTYLHPSLGGRRDLEVAWVEPLRKEIDWLTVESALGRQLDDHERLLAADVLESQSHWRRMARAAKPSTQDVKETLRGLAQMEDARVLQAYKRSDCWTQREIFTGLRKLGLDDANPTPSDIRLVARWRLAKVPSRDGRPGADVALTRAILALWRDLGGAPCKPTAWRTLDGAAHGSPIVEFARAIFAASGVAIDQPGVAARLLKEM